MPHIVLSVQVSAKSVPELSAVQVRDQILLSLHDLDRIEERQVEEAQGDRRAGVFPQMIN